ncbi:glycosyl transferase [Acetobacter aceti NRIC 0242]|uniref:Glycosyltransferase 2-like domain-containing protein n=1 Tax=Acetobacter aceti NBRC 14818 TaxID=887700 RepID=A0AB33IAD3_ACEAC|nr:glycosyltransferase [Acetobacter aceti]TCS35487.1 glycosyl transferase family 2 [Acetobacter aceti NBRC 14818]BCK75126.1 hypothetical protein EMQ_0732 [Acetobacter aceti NBRC 14818]GAN57584.1 glycosyl transferase [Acetobacter aceti NBRC 14818]GBO79357.1 glycosyl transferase [Acetobacter aceti NRIC 0242]
MAKIDVLMTVYNCSKYISETLKSIQNQTIEDIRIIIVDDGSTDGTSEIIQKFSDDDSRIIVMRQENMGIIDALKAGMKEVTADFIARHDGDDISYPERFEKQLNFLLDNPSFAAVSSRACQIDEAGCPIGKITTMKKIDESDPYSLPSKEPYLLQPMLMIRSSSFFSIGGYRNLSVSEDVDLCWRLRDEGNLHTIPEILGNYRVHPASISSQSIVNGRKLAIWAQLAAISEQRRMSKKEDIDFSKKLQNEINASSTLQEAHDILSEILLRDEAIWFASAVSAKLLEFCYYRPYEPDFSDIYFIKKSIRNDTDIKNRPCYSDFQEALISASIRLTVEGKFKEAFTLCAPHKWPLLVARVVFRIAVPETLKSMMKRKRRIS